MEILKNVKIVVFMLAFVMFCYQMIIATNNLIDPPTVDSTYERNITNDDKPLITICPTNQIMYYKLDELKIHNVLAGSYDCNETTRCFSWGAQLNLTFENLTKQIVDVKSIDDIHIVGGDFKENFVYVPGYGICKETSNLDISRELELDHYYPGYARVFLTDRNYRSYFMPDISSHLGSKIVLRNSWTHFIDVKIQVRNRCLNYKKQMTQNEFQMCVENKIHREFEENNIECVPPWLTLYNQCNSTYSGNFFGKFQKGWYRRYLQVFDVLDTTNIVHEEDCKQSCKEVTYIVNDKGRSYDGKYPGSFAFITFNRKVKVTEKVPNYSMFQYIIDVGSSMGLWLGLSVFGLRDLIVDIVKFIKNRFIMTKIRSTVSK